MPGIRSHQAVSTQCSIGGRHWSVFSVCVSQEPSLCRAHPHSQGRDRRMSWGSVCSQHDSSHPPLASAWTAHKWRSSSPCPEAPSLCTGQNHPHRPHALKTGHNNQFICQKFSMEVLHRSGHYMLDTFWHSTKFFLLHLDLWFIRAFLVPKVARQRSHVWVKVLGKCLLSMWHLSAVVDLWRNWPHSPHV